MIGNNFLLWENDDFVIRTPFNPHIPYSEGLRLVVAPKLDRANARKDPELSARTFALAARTCKAMEAIDFAPWFNLQANGNWGLLAGAEPFFHIHIWSEKTET